LRAGGCFDLDRGAGLSLTLSILGNRGSSACSLKGASDPTGRLRTTPGLAHRRNNNRGLVRFLRKAPPKHVDLRAPRFRCCFHGWSRYGQIEEAHRGLIGL